MNFGVSLLPKTAFFSDVTVTSALRSIVKVLMGNFTIFQSQRTVRMIRAKNYQQFSKFVKVTAKILSVRFLGHGVVVVVIYFIDRNEKPRRVTNKTDCS